MMTDYNAIKKFCDDASIISRTVIDEFLVYYAGEKDSLAREFDLKVASYRHITAKFDASWVRMIKSQYIAHKIFKSDGLLRKYLNHVEIKRRPAEEQLFLREQLATPWRFCFSIINSTPSPDFYEMADVFSGESFLLYSKSTSVILAEQPVMLWFNLIAYNGKCWETFGPLSGYASFDADDIFFFATEVNGRIENEEDLIADVEKNPMPYMMLLHGARIPRIINNNDEVLMLVGEHELESIDTGQLKDHFKVEYVDVVFRITHNKWTEPPHLAEAYYEEKQKLLTINAGTERAFSSFVKELNAHGIDFRPEAHIRIHPAMHVTAEEILKRKLKLNPYEHLFAYPSASGTDEELKKINRFMDLALPYINSRAKADISALAKEAGIDVAVAERIFKNTLKRIEKMGRGKRK